MILISDSMRATGMPDGQYTLGGLDVKVVGKLATLVSSRAPLPVLPPTLLTVCAQLLKKWTSHWKQRLPVLPSILQRA